MKEEGYYRIAWVSEPEDAVPVRAEAFVFAASEQTRDLHYQGAGVEILVDPSAVEVGRPLPVLLHATSPGRFVLFSVEGEDLYELRLVDLDGHDRLIQIEVEEHFVPNVFLAATSVGELRVEADRKELSVPPTRQILDVRRRGGSGGVPPRGEGTLHGHQPRRRGTARLGGDRPRRRRRVGLRHPGRAGGGSPRLLSRPQASAAGPDRDESGSDGLR